MILPLEFAGPGRILLLGISFFEGLDVGVLERDACWPLVVFKASDLIF